MCGIIFIRSLRNKPVNTILEERYFHQRNRGTEGFGFVEIHAGQKHNTVSCHAVSEDLMLKALRNSKATEMLFHHRFPTSTPNVINACHPFFTKSEDGRGFYTVHNGVLHNEDALKKDHDDRLIGYSSIQPDGKFNDSEALAWEFMLYITGQKQTFDACGSIAFVSIEVDKSGEPKKLHFARNYGSPLKKVRSRNTIQLASEGYGVDVPCGHLYTMDYETTKVTEVPFVMPSYVSTIDYGKKYGNPYEDYDGGFSRGGEYNDYGAWVSAINRDDDKELWKQKFDYEVQDDGTVKEVEVIREQPKLLSIADYCDRRETEGDDEDWEAFLKSCDEARQVKQEKDEHALPVPPLMSLEDIYLKFQGHDDFMRGIDDGCDGSLTFDYYKTIVDSILSENEELKYLNGTKALARNTEETLEIEEEVLEHSREMIYWYGVATSMYELSIEF
jgi:hypothetical protein